MDEPQGPLGAAFAKYIRVRAAQLDMNQADVADKAGMSRQTFNRYWHGQRSPGLDQMQQILRALDAEGILDEMYQRIAQLHP